MSKVSRKDSWLPLEETLCWETIKAEFRAQPSAWGFPHTAELSPASPPQPRCERLDLGCHTAPRSTHLCALSEHRIAEQFFLQPRPPCSAPRGTRWTLAGSGLLRSGPCSCWPCSRGVTLRGDGTGQTACVPFSLPLRLFYLSPPLRSGSMMVFSPQHATPFSVLIMFVTSKRTKKKEGGRSKSLAKTWKHERD